MALMSTSSQPCTTEEEEEETNNKVGGGWGVSVHPHAVQFFVRTSFRPGSIPVEASPHDTLHSICASACARLNVPPSVVDGLWFHFNGKSLPGDCTLGDSGIVKDSTLYLVQRMDSTNMLLSLRLGTDIADACKEIACISSLSLVTDRIRHARCQGRLESLAWDFLSLPVPVSQHVEIFIQSGAIESLAMLYCSSRASNIACAARCLDILLTGRKEGGKEVLSDHDILFVIPVLLQICKNIGHLLPHRRKYRTLLASLLDKHGGTCFRNRDAPEIIYGFAPVVHQISICIHENWGIHWAEDSEESCSSHSCNSDSDNFLSFLIPLCEALGRQKGSALTEEIGSPGWLKTIFDRHLEDLHDCLHYVFNVETRNKALPALFNVMKALHVMAGVCPDRMPALHSLFQSRASLLNNLIGKQQFKEGDYPWIIEFKPYLQPHIRKELALSLLPNLKQNSSASRHLMYVHRSRLMHDSFEILAYLEPEKLQRGISVEFAMEEATGPGVLREWFSLICREIFNPANALFKSCPKDARRVFPNPNSGVNSGHLTYFRFCGRVIALVLMHNIEIDTVLDSAFFKQIAGLPVSWKDIQDADPELYKSWRKILEMDAEYVDSDALALTFVAEVEQFGSRKTVELCEGGEEIQVNSSNRSEYVDMRVRLAFVTPIVEQVKAFSQGFSDLLQWGSCYHFFQILQLDELDLMLYGKDRDIDVADWKAHTEYHGYKARDKHIKWFWKIVLEMSMEQRRKLLHFSMSLSHLPIGGFAALPSKFHIHKSFSESTHFPIAHTCFYQLVLPLYPTFKIMHHRLHVVIEDDVHVGFGFV